MDLLFDLDGTLTDPAVGITSCLCYALTRLGRPAPPARELERFIGPPLAGTFAELLATEDGALVAEAIRGYRERFAETGLYENEVYPDVPAGLAALHEEGHGLWVVTSKPRVYATRIVEHFGLGRWLRGVYGSELSGENADKGDLIAHVLERERLDHERVWMIGDRAHDVLGGKRCSVRTMGVLWGYGSEEELRACRPDALVRSMDELRACVGPA